MRQTLVNRFFNNVRMQLDAWFVLPQVYSSTRRSLDSMLWEQADIVQFHNLAWLVLQLRATLAPDLYPQAGDLDPARYVGLYGAMCLFLRVRALAEKMFRLPTPSW